MNDYIRNELLYLLSYHKSDNDDKKNMNLSFLLEQFKMSLEDKKEDLKNDLKRIDNDLELVDYVKKELNIK